MEASATGEHGLESHIFIESTCKELKSLVDRVCEYVEVTPEQRKQMARMKASLDTLGRTANWAGDIKYKGTQNWDANHAQVQRKICLSIVDFMAECTRFTDLEEQARRNSPLRSWQTRQRVVAVLLAALVSTAALAVILGRLYAKQIEKPLMRIAENSVLLAKQQPLLALLPGNDELADLDLLIHHVSDAMNSAFERERAMIGNAADLICSLDEHGVFTSANAFAINMLGVEPTALVGTAVSDLTPSDYSAKADEMVSVCKASGQLQRFELPLKKSNGVIVETRWSCFWSTAENCLFSVVHDTTEENKIAQLKKDFLEMIGHELRAPLESILLTTQEVLANQSSALPDMAKSHVSSVNDNVRKMLSFANDLLNAQNLESDSLKLKIEPADVSDMISESVGLVKHLASSKQIQIESSPVLNVKTINCDKQKIVQTLTNLLSNAVKFSPSGGRVLIEVSNSRANPNPQSNLSEFVRISVIDNGPGVPKESRTQIFGAFEQLSTDIKQGTGLGLAICKSIIEAHGGAIGCDDGKTVSTASLSGSTDRLANPGNIDASGSIGSTFWFELPLTFSPP